MKCPRTTVISAYLDKELGQKEKAALETHAHSCKACTGALEDMRSVRTLFAGAEQHQAPYGFAARVMARAAQMESKKSPWLVPFSLRFAEAAVLLIVITVGIMAGRIMTSDKPTMTPINVASSFSLDLFDATPPGSLGGAYLAMTEVKNEK
jgi:anti-sigma factor RsiW